MTSLQSTDRDTRIALVTASLSAIGALIGASCAASSVAIIAVSVGELSALTSDGTPDLLAIAAGVGAFMGFLLSGIGLRINARRT